MRESHPFCAAVTWVILLVGTAASTSAQSTVPSDHPRDSTTSSRIEHAVSYLSSLGSRVAGYPGSDLAADFVEQRFREIGLEQVQREPFEIVVPIDHGSGLELTASGERFELHALWPNGIRTTTIAPPGYTGRLIYGGTGEWSQLNGHELEGSVVLLEFNSGERWLDLASVGARAIIFIEPEATSTKQADEKYASAPLDIPRFWINRRDGIDLRQRLVDLGPSTSTAAELTVRLHSRMDWEQRTTWNILGTITGTDPELSTDTIVLQAYYDGTSIAPALAPSAEASASIIGLLELARHLQQQRPARTILFVATSAHFQARQGIADFIRRHSRRHDYYAEHVPDPLDIDLFIGLELSTGTDQLGLWSNTYDSKHPKYFAPLGRVFMEHGESIARKLGRDPVTALVNGISPIKGVTWFAYTPQFLETDGQIAITAGLPALTFATVHDARLVLDTPLDDGTHLRLPNLIRQLELLKRVIPVALAEPELLAPTIDLLKVLPDKMRDLRLHTRSFPRRSQTPDRLVAEALVTMRDRHFVANGVKPTRVYRTDVVGDVAIPALAVNEWETTAYVVDPTTGAITHATDLKHFKVTFGTALTSGFGYLYLDVRWNETADHTIVLFPTLAQEIYSLLHPGSFDRLTPKIINAAGVEPHQLGYNLTYRKDSPAAVLFTPAIDDDKDRIKLLMPAMPIVNSTGAGNAEEALGRGYLPTDGPLTNTTYRAAVDIWRIDEHRLETMREHAIESAPLQRLHDEARQKIEGAARARQALEWDRYVALARAALGIESRAYPRIMATLNDVIKGLLFFLALLIPAAFFGERLVFASYDIRWQLCGFGALMLLIWTVLAFVHPAFDLAHPLAILLGFSIMAMALSVMFMVGSRFNRYAEEYKSVVARIHTADFSRIGAAYVAFMLGVSNMRRRVLRTSLTLVTLTLLTFSVLSFTSVRDSNQFAAVPLHGEAPRAGVLLNDQYRGVMEPALLDHVGSHFGGEGIISARLWYRTFGRDAKDSRSLLGSGAGDTELIAVRAGDRHTAAVDMVGLMPQEDEVTDLSSTISHGSFFERVDERTCLLSEEMAHDLGIGSTEVGRAFVQVMGSELRVRGIFDSHSVDQLHDLDGSSLMPIDAQSSSFSEVEPAGDALKQGKVGGEGTEVRSFINQPAANVLIVPYEVLRAFGGLTRSIGIRFHDGSRGRSLVEEFVGRTDMRVYAGLPHPENDRPQVYYYLPFGLGSMEGLGNLAVPILIASLIVLNAMLGAVYERFREIGIYSSIGLAPLHIAFLFIAEACAYAILGVTLGYVLGQSLGKILLTLDLLHGIELNYSSTSGIASALMVMAIVLLSTLYPARIAAQAAVPDTVRRWRPPPPDGDEWRFTFPFNISGGQVAGTCGFLYSYFSSFTGAAAGDIYTEEVRLSTAADAAAPVSDYTLDFKQWLSPYDLGVSQTVRIEFTATPAAGLYSIDMTINRVSGENFHWRRLNPRFFSMLRKQLLIWNTLDQSTRQGHAASAAGILQTRDAVAVLPLEAEQPVGQHVAQAAIQAAIQPVELAASDRGPGTGASPFSLRGILFGAVLSLIIGGAVTYVGFALGGSWIEGNASSPAAIFLFFIITAVLNVILGSIRQRFALSRADLVLIYIMMLMAVTVPNQAFAGYVISLTTGIFYYATEQNEFAARYHQYIPEWMVPQDHNAITHLYEGLPPGAAIPWDAWVTPLLYWGLLFAAISGLMICLSVILHRQWSVHERLEYPMAQVPLQMLESSSQGPLAQIGPLYRSKLTWIGFAIPAVFLSIQGLSYYFPSVPTVGLGSGLYLFDGLLAIRGIVFAWVGFSYLVNLDVSMSIWVFYVLSQLQSGALSALGSAPTERLSSYEVSADLAHQGMGACIVFVLYGLWVARHHLADVVRKAWCPQEGVDDSEELISYRTAVVGFMVSLSVMGAWLWQSGIPLFVVPLLLGISLLLYIMITRVIVTAGVASARAPLIAAFVLISGMGSSAIGATGLTALGFTYIWQAEMRLFPMIACANSLKLAETVRGPKKRLLWAIVIALGASFVGAIYVCLYISYTHGGINLDTLYYGHAKRPFTDLIYYFKNLTGPDWRGWGFTGIGAGVESLLIYAQHHFHWWRLHPLGFVIGSGWLASSIWFSVFVAWFLKFMIMKYGGMPRFITAKPFFIGLILGEVATSGIWLIVDALLSQSGHSLSRM